MPIAGEPLGRPATTATTGCSSALSVHGAATEDAREHRRVRTTYVDQARRSVEIELPEPAALGAEFVRWEIATAIAGAMLADQPVRRAERAAGEGCDARAAGRLQDRGTAARCRAPISTLPTGTRLVLSQAARTRLGAGNADAILTLLEEGDYFALLAYLGPDAALARELRTFRQAVRDRTRAATMFGYGPRYLHSTGQLHKGGPNTGVFVLITAGTGRGCADSRRAVFVRHTRARRRRSAISPRSMRPAGARCMSTCLDRIRRWCARSPMHCWRVCRSDKRDRWSSMKKSILK